MMNIFEGAQNIFLSTTYESAFASAPKVNKKLKKHKEMHKRSNFPKLVEQTL